MRALEDGRLTVPYPNSGIQDDDGHLVGVFTKLQDGTVDGPYPGIIPDMGACEIDGDTFIFHAKIEFVQNFLGLFGCLH